MIKKYKKYSVHFAWVIALFAMLMSLYFSNVLGFAPCILCWWQRILMYPLVIILIIGILYKDNKVYRYAIPLAFIGLLVSIYQNLLYYKIIPEAASPCQIGVSCTTQYINWFGFVTIPLLSLIGFAGILLLMFIYRKEYEIK